MEWVQYSQTAHKARALLPKLGRFTGQSQVQVQVDRLQGGKWQSPALLGDSGVELSAALRAVGAHVCQCPLRAAACQVHRQQLHDLRRPAHVITDTGSRWLKL